MHARRNPQAKALALQAATRDALLDIVRNLPGEQSVFQDRDRIAMPDETLRLKTGTDRDKGLLLHVLFEHYLSARQQSAQIETVCTVQDTYVRVDQHWMHVNSLTFCDVPSSDSICLKFSTSIL